MRSKGAAINTSEIESRLSNTRVRMVLGHPFFGAIALKLKTIMTEVVDTAATDGRYVYFNPNFVVRLSDARLLGLWMHVLLHVALEHPWRRGNRDPSLWNMACDHAINPLICLPPGEGGAGLELPPGGLSVPEPEYPKMSAEAIYGLLQKLIAQKKSACESATDHNGKSKKTRGKAGGTCRAKPGPGQDDRAADDTQDDAKSDEKGDEAMQRALDHLRKNWNRGFGMPGPRLGDRPPARRRFPRSWS